MKSNNILLSIGMIVKNEEKHLENCMKALLPLRNQIPSELIIVDTGSTDKTIEIAKKYADKFLEFEWCNDFSAARNYGLEKANGKWFMFLDADEYFDEDVSEMVNFFKYPELYEKYNSASYIIRNYKANKSDYDQFLGCRMVKLSDGIKFTGEIHESLPMNTPHGYFNTIVHHYGYAYVNKKQAEKKIQRNLQPLLEEYNKNPKNERTLKHLFDIIVNIRDKQKYLDEWLLICRENAKKSIATVYRNHCYSNYIAFCAYHKNYEKAEDIFNEYIQLTEIDDAVCTLQIYAMMAQIYYNQNRFQISYEFYTKYFDMYEKYKQHKLNLNDLRSNSLNAVSDNEYKESVINASCCLFKLDKNDEALKLLEKIDIDNIDLARFKEYAKAVVSSADNSMSFKIVADFYKKIIVTGNTDKINIVNKELEKLYCNNMKNDFAKEISKIDSCDTFVSIMKLVTEQNDSDIKDKIQKLIDSINDWDGGYSEIIYLAMKYNADVSKAIDKISYQKTKEQFSIMKDSHDDFAEIVLNYADIENFTNSIKQFFWLVSALETAVLSAKELDSNQQHDLYYTFIYALSDYVFNIYNTDLFNENDVEIMPPVHRFGYYMSCAMTAKDSGNDIAYIRLIKKALKDNEPMKDLVAFLMDELKKELE